MPYQGYWTEWNGQWIWNRANPQFGPPRARDSRYARNDPRSYIAEEKEVECHTSGKEAPDHDQEDYDQQAIVHSEQQHEEFDQEYGVEVGEDYTAGI